MTKSQLTIQLSSKKLDRRVSPIRSLRQTFRFNYRESPRVTFIRATQFVEYVLRGAVRDAGADESCWTSTHLVTVEVQVTDLGVSHSHVIQQTLNGSALVLLNRYFSRFTSEVSKGEREGRGNPWLSVPFQWCSVDRLMARAVDRAFGAYE